MGVDDEGRADGREQTGLRAREARNAEEIRGAYQNQRDIEVFIARPDMVNVVSGCLFLVHRLGIETGSSFLVAGGF